MNSSIYMHIKHWGKVRYGSLTPPLLHTLMQNWLCHFSETVQLLNGILLYKIPQLIP